MAARGAFVKCAAALRPDVIAVAQVAARPSIPAARGKVLATGLFRRKPLLKLKQCLGKTAPKRTRDASLPFGYLLDIQRPFLCGRTKAERHGGRIFNKPPTNAFKTFPDYPNVSAVVGQIAMIVLRG